MHCAVLRSTRKERNMTDRRSMLLSELESLQSRRRDAVETYNRTGNRAYMLEAQQTSQAIADKLSELEEVDGLSQAIDGLMGSES